MLRRRRIPNLNWEQAVAYRIKCLDRTHTNWKSSPQEWIVWVVVRPIVGDVGGVIHCIRTASGSDRPKTQSTIDFSIRLALQKLSIGPVATASGSDTANSFICFLCKPSRTTPVHGVFDPTIDNRYAIYQRNEYLSHSRADISSRVFHLQRYLVEPAVFSFRPFTAQHH